jgi:hypothetical protein
MRTDHRRRLSRLFTSSLIAIAVFGGAEIARAAKGKGKGGRSSSSTSAAPASSPSSTEAAPSVTAESGENAASSASADPFADEGKPSSEPPAKTDSPPRPAPAVKNTGAEPTEDPPPAAEPSEGGGIIERMPASAFPQPYTRGLFGSSLWLTMHGQQWPYYPRTGIGVSGYAWVDNAYAKVRIGDVSQPSHLTRYIQQGRAVLRVTPTYSHGDWFVQAQVEFVGNKDQTQTQIGIGAAADTDDMWVRAGKWKAFDITVGRFEAFEVYHLGMGLDLNTFERQGAVDSKGPGPQIYGATYMFYRPNGAGNVAVHAYMADFLRVELLGQWGNDTIYNTWGTRPAVVFDIGWLKLKGAYEYVKGEPQDPSPAATNILKRRGWGASAQLVFAPWVELGLNAGAAIYDQFDLTGLVTGRSGDTTSLGGFLNARPLSFIPRLLIGAGWNRTKTTVLAESGPGIHDSTTNTQSFLAIQYLAGGQLFIKLVGGYSRTSLSTPGAIMEGYDNDQYSVRLRLQYLF